MKKTCIALFFAAALLLSSMVLAPAASSPLGFVINPTFQISGKSYSTLSAAFDAAKNGDTIVRAGDELAYEVSAGISVTKSVTLTTGEAMMSGKKYNVHYTGTAGPLFTVEDGGILTLKDAVIYGNTNVTVAAGGFVHVKSGGTLILDGTAQLPVAISGFCLNGSNTKGGAIYVEQGGRVIVRGVTFESNSAKTGKDIYAQSRADVILYAGVTANMAAGETASSMSRLAMLSRRVAKIDCESVLPLAADANGDGVYTAADMILLARNMVA